MLMNEGIGLGMQLSEIMELDYTRFLWLADRFSTFLEAKKSQSPKD
jgi:hypothetical protein